MTSPAMPWEGTNGLQNSSQLIRGQSQNLGPSLPPVPGRNAPVVPPRPMNSMASTGSAYNSYMPYSGVSGYGGYNSYGSYGLPYRSPLYSSYGSSYGNYNSYGMYGNAGLGYPNYSSPQDHERRFIQYAEESSRHTFANVESVVRAFNSLATMLDNTFFAMTSSFRAVLSVAENFGRLRTMFGHVWYSVNIFRFFSWLYRKMRKIMGLKVAHSATSIAWKEAAHGIGIPPSGGASPGSSWPTLAFLGVLISAPYIISKFLPKYEDKGDPANWKSPGVRAKACFEFIATSPNELSIHTNDIILLAPAYIQEEMNLKNSGWAFAVFNGKSGVVPLNYLVISKTKPITQSQSSENVPVPRIFNNMKNENQSNVKTHTKRVSFGENQIFDLDDYVVRNEASSSQIEKEKLDSKEKVKDSILSDKKEVENKNNNNNYEKTAS